MKTVENMEKDELLEIIKIKDHKIKKMEKEIQLYQKLIEQLKKK